ncbi:MAG: hypothetical protein K2O45_05830 [Oscillospiraceae bacterium]|nr:hypothetical protein [Oscillospiraceae bacterium]
MKLIKQPMFETCGQACIAMIAGKDVDTVIKDMKTNGRITSFLGIIGDAPAD